MPGSAGEGKRVMTNAQLAYSRRFYGNHIVL
jgi:hypothetical protein